MKINYLSDFKVNITLELGGVPIGVPDNDFTLEFTTVGSKRYRCQRRGDVWTNCKPFNDAVQCLMDNHGLPCGALRVRYYDYAPDIDMPDGNLLTVTPETLDVELVMGAGDGTDVEASVATDVASAVASCEAAVAATAASATAASASASLASAKAAEAGGYVDDVTAAAGQASSSASDADGSATAAASSATAASASATSAANSASAAAASVASIGDAVSRAVGAAASASGSASAASGSASEAASSASSAASSATAASGSATAAAASATAASGSATSAATSATAAAASASEAASVATTTATNVATTIAGGKADKVVRVDKTSDPATSFVLDAGKIYDFGVREFLEVSLAAYTGDDVPIWAFTFESGAKATSLDIPATWEILGGTLEIEAGYTYEFNVSNNLCAYGKFKTT